MTRMKLTLRGFSEVTISRLKEKLKEYEDKMEETIQGRVKEKERQLQRQFAERERSLQEQQLQMAQRLGEAEHQAFIMRSAMVSVLCDLFMRQCVFAHTHSNRTQESTQSELFDTRGRLEEVQSAQQSA